MDANYYQTPSSETLAIAPKRIKLGKWLFVIGTVFQLGILWGFVATLTKVITVFNEITLHGTGDPSLMSEGISGALVYQLLGFLIALPGLVLHTAALLISSYRTKYFNNLMFIFSIVWILSFPTGSLFGLVFLIIWALKRNG